MKRVTLICILASLGAAACDGAAGKDRSWAKSTGDWGWDDGAGCANLSDAVRVKKTSLAFFSDGEEVSSATLLNRAVLNIDKSTKEGSKVDGISWIYRIEVKDGEPRTYEERFRIRRDDGKSVSLVAVPRRYVTLGEDGERMREENPRSGQRLAPCDG